LAYLGNQPSNNFVSLKRQVITGNGGTSYTLDHSVASVNDVAIFVNNVRQDPSTYSISSTTLQLGGSISSSDSCYVIFLGQALQTVTPATGTVTNAMLGETITVAKGGTGLTSGFENGITEADQFRITADTTSDGTVNTNWERVDTDGFNKIGTGLTESSGIFSFPQTGIYLISVTGLFLIASGDNTVTLSLQVTLDNSSYNTASEILIGNTGSSQCNIIGHNAHIFNVTDISNRKFKLEKGSFASGTTLRGTTAATETNFFVIRLGDSV